MLDAVSRYLEGEREAVNAELRRFFVESKREIRGGRYSREMFASLEHTTLYGTHKRLRPILCIAAYNLAGGRNLRLARKAGVMLELFHRSLLIHDDVMDRDTIRHGQLTVHEAFRRRFRSLGKSSAEHLGVSFGILVGDLAIEMGLDALARLPVLPEMRQTILRILIKAVRQTIEGQVDELELSHLPRIRHRDIDGIIERKSVHYTFLAPLKIGATLATASPAVLRSLNAYGENIGRAFQIQDDLLDIFGSTSVIGKPVGSDIREGKRTWIFLEALRRSSTKDRAFLSNLVERGKVTAADLKRVRQIFRSSGALAQTHKELEKLVNKGIAALKSLKSRTIAKDALLTLAKTQLNRLY